MKLLVGKSFLKIYFQYNIAIQITFYSIMSLADGRHFMGGPNRPTH